MLKILLIIIYITKNEKWKYLIKYNNINKKKQI